MNIIADLQEQKTRKLINFKKIKSAYMIFLHPVTSIFIFSSLTVIFLTVFRITPINVIIESWGSGLKTNFKFAMQFMLLLLLSYTIGITPTYLKFVRTLSRLYNNQRTAIIGLTIFSSFLSFFNWGLGVVGGVFLAKSIAESHQRDGKSTNLPLLVAAGLSGLVVSESGFSSNVMLFMTQSPLNITLNNSVLTNFNIVVNVIVVVSITFVLLLFSCKKTDKCNKLKTVNNEPILKCNKPTCIAEKMETSQIVSILFGGIGLYYCILHFCNNGMLDFKTYLLLLISIGVILRKRPLSFQEDVTLSSNYAWIFFFPLIFSGAIQGMLHIENVNSFLNQVLLTINSKSSFLLFNILSAYVGNFFIPNSGAQWIIFGKNILATGEYFNISTEFSILSFCYGAGVVKILNVFILLPILSLVPIKLKSLLKYIICISAVSTITYILVLLSFI